MSHQSKAVTKLLPIRVGALFMEMGTGKTRTAIQFIHDRIHKISNVIYFCPVSLKDTVYNEFVKHTDIIPYQFDTKTSESNLPNALVYIVGIESMASSNRMLFAVMKLMNETSFVIVDESTYIKGHDSKRTMRITKLSEIAKYRLILTGTPLSQGVVDLYSQMKFLSPKILGFRSFYSFAANHLEYSEKFKNKIVRAHNVDQIAAKIQPYIYQVQKSECIDLPSKIYQSYCFSMTYEQQYHYEIVKERFFELIDRDWIDSYAVFQVFTDLQRIVSGYAKVNHEIIKLENNRCNTLMEIITQIPLDKKIVIWCKYHKDIQEITQAIESEYGNCISHFNGKLSEKERKIELQKFRESNRFFVSTQQSGGHGLNLTESHNVIFYSNTFKYADRIQSEDRCHRIGQTNKVLYNDIICRDSIDVRIATILSNKENVADRFKSEIEKVKNKKAKKKLIKMFT